MIILSAAAAGICFGALACSENIRIDTEELINNPGTSLGWLTIGRFGLVLLKKLLGLTVHSAWKSGILFLLFFVAGANLLAFLMYHFSGKKDGYSYASFLFLYLTSNIWCFQVYFSLQQAEVAFAMLLLIFSAYLMMSVCFGQKRKGKYDWIKILVAVVLLVIAFGTYQALAAFYIAICAVLFLMYLEGLSSETKQQEQDQNRNIWIGIVVLVIQFGVSYLIYHITANTWFMATGEYMGDQMGWGRYTVWDCIKNVLRTAKNVLAGYGPRNYSFYTIGVLLVSVLVLAELRVRVSHGKQGEGAYKKGDTTGRFVLWILALILLLASPFLMTLYMGEMLVTRSQFALPVVAAFLAMYGMGKVQRLWQDKRWIKKAAIALIVGTVILQGACCLHLTRYDNLRFAYDKKLTDQVVEVLTEEMDGVFLQMPVFFVGYREAEVDDRYRRTEMYGWSFYEWDYSLISPTGASHRITGFIKASHGIQLNEQRTKEQEERAVYLAEEMPEFPQEGSVRVMDSFVIVKLSDVSDKPDTDWY